MSTGQQGSAKPCAAWCGGCRSNRKCSWPGRRPQELGSFHSFNSLRSGSHTEVPRKGSPGISGGIWKAGRARGRAFWAEAQSVETRGHVCWEACGGRVKRQPGRERDGRGCTEKSFLGEEAWGPDTIQPLSPHAHGAVWRGQCPWSGASCPLIQLLAVDLGTVS